jgi:2-methylcitrate dehydratase PrpD
VSIGAGARTLTQELVAAALDGYVEAEAQAAGSRALFDHLACLTAGRREAPAAMGDAGAAVLLDRDDLHWPSLTHPGAIVWTVLRQAGAEGTARLGRALGSEHRRYWHATTTAGTVGAAVAGALALGTDPVAAAGHAISVTGGSILCMVERSGTRMVHRDHAAATALRCAELAGVPATREGLEHPRGLFAAMGGSAELLLAPAQRPALSDISFRRHATSGFAQAIVEAARELGPVDPEGPVLAEAPEGAVALAGIAAPRDAEEAWWSCQHAVAVTLLGLDLEDRTLAGDPRVAALRERIELRAGPTSSVTVDGLRAECAAAAPMTDTDLVAKWRTLNPDVPPPLELLG